MGGSKPLTIRIGTLGAARITPRALIAPARAVPGIEVAALAARDLAKARAFAAKHGIPRVHASYEELVADPTIDAVYNPLPNSLHCEWTIRALRAGKHVLCEKPIASNRAEAEEMAQVAQETGLVLMEAFHYRYHPLLLRAKAFIDGGVIGAVRHVEAHFCIPMLRPGDIRFRLDLAGGATMDVGCYAIHCIRTLAGAEPEVVRARAELYTTGVDRYMEADFRFADGRSGRMVCSLLSANLLDATATVRGETGELHVVNPFVPQLLYNRLTVCNERGRYVEEVRGDATYTYQLRAFARAVRLGAVIPTGPADAVANMRVIDAVYTQAGLRPRGH